MPDKKIKVIDKLQADPLFPIRHSAQHIMAMSVESLYKDARKVMGPPIENGFYGDFDIVTRISADDFPKVEERMSEIIDADLPFEMKELSYEEAKKLFSDDPYKLELIEEFNNEGKKITVCEIGDRQSKFHDVDLCAGNHVHSTSEIKAYKLQSVAGAYWRGNEKNKMLTRIYATAFDTKEKLQDYLNNLEEAKRRDHRKLGKELELFHLDDTAPGMPYLLPNGVIIMNELINYWRVEHTKRDYQELITPLINKKELYETSGHWEHYKDNMFIAQDDENNTWCVKPMNCPNAMIVFGLKNRSYKELPLRLSDCDVLHRKEKAGALLGLLRVQHLQQDDAHIFVSEDQIEDEYNRILDIADEFYNVFGLKFTYRFGARPDDFMGDPKVWDRAEEALVRILDKRVGKGNYVTGEKEGAFYGPKIDIMMEDSLSRTWQMGTIQLDFQLPGRFNLKYIDKDGTLKTPVVIHRVIYGSLERFFGVLIEHFAGAFPVWISPVQAKIVTISENHVEYAQKVKETLASKGIRVRIDDRSESMQSKIRDAQLQKIPYILVVGDKEAGNNTASVRLRSNENLGPKPISEIADKISEMYLTRSLNLW